MKPAPFTYHAPESLDEAVGLLAEYGDEAKPLAGGQSLVPLLALRLARFEHLVDLGRIPALVGIDRADGEVRIGAMTRQRAAEKDGVLAGSTPLLAQALPWIGHFQIRNRGTVGGSIAHADPAAELPAVASALDATFEITSKSGTRTLGADAFFEGTFMTALGDDELLTAIRFPVWNESARFSMKEFARRSGDFAITGVACGIEANNGTVTRAAIAFLGMGSTPVRGRSAEQALVGTAVKDLDLRAAAEAAVGDTEPGDDIHASAAHRRRVAIHLTEQALAACTASDQTGGTR